MKNWKMPCLLSRRRNNPKSFTLRLYECLGAGAGPYHPPTLTLQSFCDDTTSFYAYAAVFSIFLLL